MILLSKLYSINLLLRPLRQKLEDILGGQTFILPTYPHLPKVILKKTYVHEETRGNQRQWRNTQVHT